MEKDVEDIGQKWEKLTHKKKLLEEMGTARWRHYLNYFLWIGKRETICTEVDKL